MRGHDNHYDIVIAGGGLAGLAAAAFAARAGASVALFERSSAAGGRAATTHTAGFDLNLGAHASYNAGAARRAYDELGVEVPGGPPGRRTTFLYQGRLHRAPDSFRNSVSGRFLGLRAWAEVLRAMVAFRGKDHPGLEGVTFQEWVDSFAKQPRARATLFGLARLTTYANDPARLSAAAAIEQVGLGLRGVTYVDGGWETIVKSLRRVAEGAGARIETGTRVAEVRFAGARATGVALAGGEEVDAGAVIIAAGPADVASLLPGALHQEAARWQESLVPSRAAVLDVGLSRLPNPAVEVVIGADESAYLSVFSVNAKVAPPGGAVIHLMKYLAPDDACTPAENEAKLESLLDLAQPGWRDLVVTRRFLPALISCHGIPLASEGGIVGRPAVEFPGAPGLYLAGDWVGDEGMIADAAVASGRRAGELAAARVSARVAVAS